MIFNLFGGRKPEQEKTVTATTAPVAVTPDTGYALSKVTVNPTPSQIITVTPTAAGMEVVPDSGKVLSKVIVNGDTNHAAENIRKDVNIFGINGTYEGAGQNAWKKGVGANYNPYIKFTVPEGDGSEISYLNISGHDFAPNMTLSSITNESLFGKTATHSRTGPLLKFGNTANPNSTLTDYYALYVVFDGSEELIGVWKYMGAGVLAIQGFGANPAEEYTLTLDPVSGSTFQEFVVSNDASKYPAAGTHTDGYYYEKIDV